MVEEWRCESADREWAGLESGEWVRITPAAPRLQIKRTEQFSCRLRKEGEMISTTVNLLHTLITSYWAQVNLLQGTVRQPVNSNSVRKVAVNKVFAFFNLFACLHFGTNSFHFPDCVSTLDFIIPYFDRSVVFAPEVVNFEV